MKAINKFASGPQAWLSLSQMRNMVSTDLSGTPKETLHVGIKRPDVLAPVVHQSHWFSWKDWGTLKKVRMTCGSTEL